MDLATTDSVSAKTFYGELFGREAEEMPAGEAGTYTMLSVEGDAVCSFYGMEAKGRECTISPHWFSYVSVEDADATASRAHGRRDTVYGEAFNVLDGLRPNGGDSGPYGRGARGLGTAGTHRRRPGQGPQLPNLERAPQP